MSARTTRRRYSAIAVLPLVFTAVAAPAATASVIPRDPGSMYRPAEVVPSSWPDEGSGYPGYADQPAAGSQYRVVTQRDWFDTTSIALGALGGIALGGAGLGVALGLQRRRDHVFDPGSDHA
jgi:hypothetical protein